MRPNATPRYCMSRRISGFSLEGPCPYAPCSCPLVLPTDAPSPRCARCGGKQSIVVTHATVISVEPCPVCSPHDPAKIRDTFAASPAQEATPPRDGMRVGAPPAAVCTACGATFTTGKAGRAHACGAPTPEATTVRCQQVANGRCNGACVACSERDGPPPKIVPLDANDCCVACGAPWPAAPTPKAARATDGGSLAARADFAAASIRAAVVGGKDDSDELAEWFNPGFLITTADIINELRATVAALTAERTRLLAKIHQQNQGETEKSEATPPSQPQEPTLHT